ncbi:MAG: leucine-rich repeat domain-containing protein [Bacteroidaceae bacterium]|nr:leucine-rich repeat domain-containing protein [Bacteroidaceae bacterium]
MKRLLFLLLLLQTTLMASAYDIEVNGMCFNLTSDSTVAVTYLDFIRMNEDYYIGDVVVPASINYKGKKYAVTAISNKAFCGCSYLMSVTLPSTIVTIEDDAFLGCTALESVEIPEGVKELGDAFSGSDRLKTIVIPSTVTQISSRFISNCQTRKEIVCKPLTPPSISTEKRINIEEYDYNRCTLIVPRKSIETYRAADAWNLFNRIGGFTVDKKGGMKIEMAFTEFTEDGLKYMVMSESPKEVMLYGYEGEKPTGELIIPAKVQGYSVTSIGGRAFERCQNLTMVTIPNSVTSIGYRAFFVCAGLTSIEIPNSVTTIGNEAFSSCTSLESVLFAEGSKLTCINFATFEYCRNLASVIIPNGVTTIGQVAFCGCDSLTSVSIPNSVTNIERGAFSVSGLTSIIIPSSVTSIGNTAFFACRSLKSVQFAEGSKLTSIGDMAFYNNEQLEPVTLPASVKEVGKDIFGTYKSLQPQK